MKLEVCFVMEIRTVSNPYRQLGWVFGGRGILGYQIRTSIGALVLQYW